jgi:Mg2+/citrate symporter
MKAHQPKFLWTNVGIAVLWSLFLWLIFGGTVPLFFFLIPFYWIQHVRNMNSQLQEIYDRQEAMMGMLATVLEKDPDFDVRDYFASDYDDDDD